MSKRFYFSLLFCGLLASVVFAAEGLKMRLEAVSAKVKSGDPVRVRVTFSNESDKPFVVVWTYDNRRPMSDEEKRQMRELFESSADSSDDSGVNECKEHDQGSFDEKIVLKSSWFRHVDGVLYAVESRDASNLQPSRYVDSNLDALMTLYPGMYVSEEIWVLPRQSEICHACCDLKTGENELRIAYYLSPEQAEKVEERRSAQRELLLVPFVGVDPLLTGPIYSNPITIEVVE